MDGLHASLTILATMCCVVINCAHAKPPPCDVGCPAGSRAFVSTEVDSGARWCERDGLLDGPFFVGDPLGRLAGSLEGHASSGKAQGVWLHDNIYRPRLISRWNHGLRAGNWYEWNPDTKEFSVSTYVAGNLVKGLEPKQTYEVPVLLDRSFILGLLPPGSPVSAVDSCDDD